MPSDTYRPARSTARDTTFDLKIDSVCRSGRGFHVGDCYADPYLLHPSHKGTRGNCESFLPPIVKK